MPLLKWSWIAAVALFAAAITAVLLWLFLTWTGQPDAQVRIDAVKTALSVGAGAGGVFALWLAARRQRTAELQLVESTRIAGVTQLDLEERRVTELYTKAVEQLGSDKAPVRLGGLYALERLGQDNPRQRQMIVNVICAYLRMPYKAPERGLRGGDAKEVDDRGDVAELQVRLAAQDILHSHVREGDPKFWPDTSLDLQLAVLVDFRLSGCVLAGADFSRATFFGATHIRGTTFTGETGFYGADFTAPANFSGTAFEGGAFFSRAHFRGDARFIRVRSVGFLPFQRARFDGEVVFGEGEHEQPVDFTGARFAVEPSLGGIPAIGHNSDPDAGD